MGDFSGKYGLKYEKIPLLRRKKKKIKDKDDLLDNDIRPRRNNHKFISRLVSWFNRLARHGNAKKVKK